MDRKRLFDSLEDFVSYHIRHLELAPKIEIKNIQDEIVLTEDDLFDVEVECTGNDVGKNYIH